MTTNAKPAPGLNSFALKIIAAVTMLIDHIGYALYPGVLWLRCIGRIAFPLYCFMIAEGAAHTRSFPKYALRLLIFAIISEIPFDLMIYGRAWDIGGQNVFFTLLFGLLAIKSYERLGGIKRFYLSLPAMAAFAAAAWAINADYGWYGVAMIAVFYCFRSKKLWQCFFFALLVALCHMSLTDINLFAILAALPIILYNGRPGPRAGRYYFYAFYPAHMLILALLGMLSRII